MSDSTLSNGHHPADRDEQASEGPEASNVQPNQGTTEERLAAIARAIDEWDWRAGYPDSHDTATMTAVPPPPPAPPTMPSAEPSAMPPAAPFVVTNILEPTNAPAGVVAYGEATVGTEPEVAPEPVAAPETVATAAIPGAVTTETRTDEVASPEEDAASSAGEGQPPAPGEQFFSSQAAPASSRRKRRVWPWLLALAVVTGAGVGYWKATSRHHAAAPPPPVSVVHPKTTPQTHGPTVASSLAAAEAKIDSASVALTTGLDASHGIPTTAGLATIVNPYVTALQQYSIELALIKWPKSATSDSQALRTQVTDFTTFLQTLSATQPQNLGAWLTQLHTDGAAVSTATIQLRNQLGIYN
jgi:hypothetical protein